MFTNGNNLRRFDGFSVDLEKKILWVGQSRAELPFKAVELLCVLIEQNGEVISREELLDGIWGDCFVEENVLTQNIYLLRKTFREIGVPDGLIETVPRRGYRFFAEEEHANEITIEREFVSQTYLSETEIEDPDSRPSRSSNENRSSRVVHVNVMFSVLVLSALVAAAAIGVALVRFYDRSAADDGDRRDLIVDYEDLIASARALYVGLSPDDQNAAYVLHTPNNEYSLVLKHLPSNSEMVVIAPQKRHLYNIQFSPDGSFIYFGGAQGTEKSAVFRIPVFGGTPQLITRRPVHHFSISPDGTRMAFYRREPAERSHYLDVCDSSGATNCKSLMQVTNGAGFKIWGASPAWSHDGRKLLVSMFAPAGPGSGDRQHLSEVDTDSGEVREIPSPPWHAVHQAYWSKDGNSIFVMVRESSGDPVQLWRLEYPSGKAFRLTNDTDDYREFRPSSDGSFMLAAVWKKSENLFLVPVDEPNNTRQLTFDVSGRNGAWSLRWLPDGRRIVYSQASGHLTGNLWMIDTDTLVSSQITFDESSLPSGADISPDGESVIFESNRSGIAQIWEVGLDGLDLRNLTSGGVAAEPEVSPDGNWLYYTQDGLWKQKIGGTEREKVLTDSPGLTRVSPANPKVFASFFFDRSETRDSPWKLGVFREDTGGDPHLISSRAIVFTWKPDGSALYFVDNGETFSNIWLHSLETSEATQITNFSDQKISNFDLSPDGTRFVVSRGASTGRVVKISVRDGILRSR